MSVEGRRFWCVDCDEVATESCLDEHCVRNFKALRTKEVQPLLDTLKQEETIIARMRDILSGLDLHQEKAFYEHGLQIGQTDRASRAEALRSALDMDAGAFDAAKQSAWLSLDDDFRQGASLLLTYLEDPTTLLSVNLHRSAGSAEPAMISFNQIFSLSDYKTAQVLLCQLVSDGLTLQCRANDQHDTRKNDDPTQDEVQPETCTGDQMEDETVQEEAEEQTVDGNEERMEEEEPGIHFQATWLEQRNEGLWTGEDTITRLKVGSRVAPGLDLGKAHHQYDRGGHGTITSLYSGLERIKVKWDLDTHSSSYATREYCMSLKYGDSWSHRKRFDLQLLPVPLKVPLASVPSPLPKEKHMNLETMSADAKAVGRTKLALENDKIVLGLHCDLAPDWSRVVLERTSSTLEELELVSAQREHMRVVSEMPRLRSLHLRGAGLQDASLPLGLQELRIAHVTLEQLVQVARMPALLRLEVHCPFDAPLPVLSFRPAAPGTGLRWLRTGVYPLSTALSLMAAHASTLQELELVASTSAPYGCSDLAAQLQRCGLVSLRRLVLLRASASGTGLCTHEAAACEQQRVQLWKMFVESGAIVTVLCSECV
ncbi:uncharacterized protein LOC117651809 [Thrips palmi]|uniref:Uncharacterized protein LOC117651809 n=1 Tax=Thrips palmi TaxID=161013 RepID=A0A6P9A2M0_THRPL|nr:uncharacterized protein LOC117651809 [Thrips palmi]